MKWFYDLKIGTKLLCSFVLVALIAGVIGWAGYSGVSRTNEIVDAMYSARLVPIRDLAYVNTALDRTRMTVLAMMATKNLAERQKWAAEGDAQIKKVGETIEAFTKVVSMGASRQKILLKEEEEALPKFRAALVVYVNSRAKTVSYALKMQDAAALE
ncbi:MAG: MCP four helix bundle domain-containing protein [Acidobacteria bacterium]|nr:MCP four helix bundle domain-containing protein [Acidobacteriota bacterium]